MASRNVLAQLLKALIRKGVLSKPECEDLLKAAGNDFPPGQTEEIAVARETVREIQRRL
jgi:hypothetical protein